ncbi:ArsR/SmtB family transcription factor [Candidatus Eisenbacteria bacterium]|uniref:ArsR/SmtB family transcription factor n=1 Tax=Eiseniibacteriota bacterium TaxID=2212470 RepID=A0ABV6YIF3_UNCEI
MKDRCCQVFQAMGDKTRLKILELLNQNELCVSEICKGFDMTQPSISHHLDMLKRAGLVVSEKRGREVYYRSTCNTIVDCCCRQMRTLDIILKRK